MMTMGHQSPHMCFTCKKRKYNEYDDDPWQHWQTHEQFLQGAKTAHKVVKDYRTKWDRMRAARDHNTPPPEQVPREVQQE